MKILKFHIVGLTHNDVKNCEVQYAKEAVGKTLCLVPDDANPFDLLAVKAYEGQKSIGFVSALEAEDVRAAIMHREIAACAPDAWLATARKKTVKPGFISK